MHKTDGSSSTKEKLSINTPRILAHNSWKVIPTTNSVSNIIDYIVETIQISDATSGEHTQFLIYPFFTSTTDEDYVIISVSDDPE